MSLEVSWCTETTLLLFLGKLTLKSLGKFKSCPFRSVGKLKSLPLESVESMSLDVT
jgi:hypothetical protein